MLMYGTDYSHNVGDFTKQINLESSNDWSYNGSCSLKFQCPSRDSYNLYTTEYYCDEMPTGNYLFSVKIYSPSAGSRIALLLKDSTQSTINIPPSNEVQTISLSITNNAITGFRLLNDSLNEPIYYDDFKLVPQ